MIATFLLAAFDLAQAFASPTDWSVSAIDFAVEHRRDGFNFASEKRDIVNCLVRGACTWHGFEVWETRVYYGPTGAKRVEMSLYNRGDDKFGAGLSEEELEVLLARLHRTVDPAAKTPPKAESRKLRTGGSHHVRAYPKADPAVEAVWGLSEGRVGARSAEYVRVTLTPRVAPKPKGAVKSVSGVEARAKVKANVKKTPEGDVRIDNVPMVDQGQKGYCAAAVSERILRYYGHDVDEHEIAQLAGSSAAGTSLSAMKDAVKAFGVRCRLGFTDIVSTGATLADVERDVARYNKAAKSAGAPQIAIDAFTAGNIVDVGAIHAAMEPKVLKTARTKDSGFQKFLNGVRTQVDQGVPVFWGVELGVFPEAAVSPQTVGGHMRLIIGYNRKTKEILYTDTWGAGHELKRMPEDWAYVITHDAFCLRPL